MSVRDYELTIVFRPIFENGVVVSRQSIYVLLVDRIIGDKVTLHPKLRNGLADIVNNAGHDGEVGFVWFLDDGSGRFLFSIPDNEDWIDYFETELHVDQFENIVDKIRVDLSLLDV